MDQRVNRPMQSRTRSKEEILQILEEQANSGMSIKLFCEERGVNRITFNKWRSRYRQRAEGQESKGGFTQLHIVSPDNHEQPVLFAEVRGIKIYQPVDAAYLKALLL